MNKLVLFLTGIVLIGIAGFAMMWFGTGRELQAPAVAYLIQCRDGEYAKAYEAAHPKLREGQSVEQLEALWDLWKSEHGVFGEVLQRLSVRAGTDEDTWSRSITLELGFYKGHILGRFYFLRVDEQPRLVHVWLTPKPTTEVAESDRSSLEPSARAAIALVDASDFVGLYDALDPDLQMGWTLKALAEQMLALRTEAGAVKSITLTGTDDKEKAHHVSQRFAVEFENAQMELRVTHRHDRGQWSIVGFEAR